MRQALHNAISAGSNSSEAVGLRQHALQWNMRYVHTAHVATAKKGACQPRSSKEVKVNTHNIPLQLCFIAKLLVLKGTIMHLAFLHDLDPHSLQEVFTHKPFRQ